MFAHIQGYPDRHVDRAKNWIRECPLADNAVVLLMDAAATGQVHYVSRLKDLQLTAALV